MIPSLFEILAQNTPPGGGPSQPASPFGSLFFGLMLAAIVFYIFLFRGQGRKKKEIAKMIQGLKKNDRIVTIGGIVGTVISTKEDEVVVRVDESNNIKMTFVRQSIQRVLTDEPKTPKN